MKGTLYSSDFVKNSLGELKLLEFNTDTDFPSASLSHFDWTPLIDVISSSSINEVHVVSKKFQENIVLNLSESLHASNYNVSFTNIVETRDTIYPTDIEDGANVFILRMAYNEAAIFDSEYCKNELELYKLFSSDTNGSTYTIPHYVSSSNDEYENNTLTETFNSANVPDVAIKKQAFSDGPTLNFYKIGNSSDTDSNRYSSFLSTYEDGDIVSNYIDTSESTNYMKSYRAANILYGTELSIMNIASYKIDSWVDKPTSITFDDTQISNLIDNKHRYEFATNWPKEYWKNGHGVYSESELVNVSGSLVKAKDTVVDELYKSIDIVGLPDTDNADQIFSWSFAGNTLPEGTSITSSALVTKDSSSVEYGVLTEISSSNNSSVIVGNALPLLVYNVNEDLIEFEYSYNIITGSYQLFDESGSRIDVVENNLVIFEGEEFTYELNMETDDTYLINNSGVLLTAHNPFYKVDPGFTCFLAGTKIQTPSGDINIEDIVVGDIVQSWDESNQRFAPGTVSEIDHSHTVGDHIDGCRRAGYGEPGIFKLKVDMSDGGDETSNDLGLRFTPEHPFLTKRGWAAISPLTNQEPWVTQQEEVVILEVGDFVKFDDHYESGKWLEIKSIEFEPMDGTTPVYNFTVPEFNNYCANWIVAHNK